MSHIAICKKCPNTVFHANTQEEANLKLARHNQSVHEQGYRPSSSWITCPRCNGTGKFAGEKCTKCGGTGQL